MQCLSDVFLFILNTRTAILLKIQIRNGSRLHNLYDYVVEDVEVEPNRWSHTHDDTTDDYHDGRAIRGRSARDRYNEQNQY